jgi:hypothetical protein
MAFSSSLTIADEANVSKTFVENYRQGSKAIRIDSASTLSSPLLLTIDHFETSVKGVPAVRHLIQLSKAVTDSNEVRSDTIVNLTVTVPQSAVAGDPDELVGYLINFIIGTNAARTLANLDELLLNQS